jgi:hypothetical protein
MDIILLGITIVSLVVALLMSVAAWRLTREEKQRSAARVAALSVAASAPEPFEQFAPQVEKPAVKAPWARTPFDSTESAPATSVSLRTATPSPAPPELLLNQAPNIEREPAHLRQGYRGQVVTHASGFLGATELPRDNGGRQKTLAFAAVMLFVVLSGGLVWMMSGPEGTSAAAVGPNSPLELVSLTHARQNEKLAVSGLVRNPVNGKPVEHLSAVVFLFDRMGTFVTSSRANVDFLNLGAGDESPFVVSLDAPATVSRYRVSFRTDEGIVPHIDRRQAETVGIQQSTVKSEIVRQQ